MNNFPLNLDIINNDVNHSLNHSDTNYVHDLYRLPLIKLTPTSSKHRCNIATLNIVSINNKIDDVYIFCSSNFLDILCLQETRTDQTNKELFEENNIDPCIHQLSKQYYNFNTKAGVKLGRRKKTNEIEIDETNNIQDKMDGAGLMTIVSKKMGDCEFLKTLSTPNFQVVALHKKRILVVNTYINPHSEVKTIITEQLVDNINMIGKLSKYDKYDIYIAGDFNTTPDKIKENIMRKLILNQCYRTTTLAIPPHLQNKQEWKTYKKRIWTDDDDSTGSCIDNIMIMSYPETKIKSKIIYDAQTTLTTDHRCLATSIYYQPLSKYKIAKHTTGTTDMITTNEINYNHDIPTNITPLIPNNVPFLPKLADTNFRRILARNNGYINNRKLWLEIDLNTISSIQDIWYKIKNICHSSINDPYNKSYKYNKKDRGKLRYYYDTTTCRLIKRYNQLNQYLNISRQKLKEITKTNNNNDKLSQHLTNLSYKDMRKTIHKLIDECAVEISTNIKRQKSIRYEKIIKRMNVNQEHRNCKRSFDTLKKLMDEYDTEDDDTNFDKNIVEPMKQHDDHSIILNTTTEIAENWRAFAINITSKVKVDEDIITKAKQIMNNTPSNIHQDMDKGRSTQRSKEMPRSMNAPITVEEIKQALIDAPNFRSAGPDHIPIEVLKAMVTKEGESLNDVQDIEINDEVIENDNTITHIKPDSVKLKYVKQNRSPIEHMTYRKIPNINLNTGEETKNSNITGINIYTTTRGNNEWMENRMLVTFMHIFNKIFCEQQLVDEWNNSEITTLYKSGDKQDVNNYRFISLISTTQKLLHSILNSRLIAHLMHSDKLSYEQTGFMPEEETGGQVASLMEICSRRESERIRFYNHHNPTQKKVNNKCNNTNTIQTTEFNTFIFFLDLKKAFDSVPHDVLFQLLINEFDIKEDTNFYKYLFKLYNESTISFRVNEVKSTPLQLERGLRQGCPMSPTLFNVFVNHIIKLIRGMNLGVDIPEATNNYLWGEKHLIYHDKYKTFSTVKINSLWYADDSACFTKNFEDMMTIISNITILFNQYGIQLGYNKCGIMPMFDAKIPEQYIVEKNGSKYCNIDGNFIPIVKEYKYLGHNIPYNLDINKMITKRIKQNNIVVERVIHLCNNKYLSTATKKQAIYTWVIPRLMYNCEVWGPIVLGNVSTGTRPHNISSAGKKIVEIFETLSRCVIDIGRKDKTATSTYAVQRESCITTPQDYIISAAIRFYLKFYQHIGTKTYKPISPIHILLNKPHNYIEGGPSFSIALNLQEIRYIFRSYEIQNTYPHLYKMLTLHTRTWRSCSYGIHPSELIPRHERVNKNNQQRALVLTNIEGKLEEVLDAKTFIDNESRNSNKLTKTIRKTKIPTQFSIYYNENKSAGSEHNFMKIYHLFPQYYRGFQLLQHMRVGSFRFTHRILRKTSNITCIGCCELYKIRSKNHTQHNKYRKNQPKEDALHLLTQCPTWFMYSLKAFHTAYQLTASKPAIQRTAERIRSDKGKAILQCKPSESWDIIYRSQLYGNEGLILPEYIRSGDQYDNTHLYHLQQAIYRVETHGISYILSDYQYQQRLKIHQPLIWLWLAIFLQDIEPIRKKLLSKQSKYFLWKPKDDD